MHHKEEYGHVVLDLLKYGKKWVIFVDPKRVNFLFSQLEARTNKASVLPSSSAYGIAELGTSKGLRKCSQSE